MFSCKSVFILLSHEQGCKLYSRLFLICRVLTVLKLVVFWGLDSRGRWRCMLFINTCGLPVHKIKGCSDLGKKNEFQILNRVSPRMQESTLRLLLSFICSSSTVTFLLDFFCFMLLYPAKQTKQKLADTDSYPQPKNSLTIDAEETWTKFLSALPFISFSPVRNDSNLSQINQITLLNKLRSLTLYFS